MSHAPSNIDVQRNLEERLRSARSQALAALGVLGLAIGLSVKAPEFLDQGSDTPVLAEPDENELDEETVAQLETMVGELREGVSVLAALPEVREALQNPEEMGTSLESADLMTMANQGPLPLAMIEVNQLPEFPRLRKWLGWEKEEDDAFFGEGIKKLFLNIGAIFGGIFSLLGIKAWRNPETTREAGKGLLKGKILSSLFNLIFVRDESRSNPDSSEVAKFHLIPNSNPRPTSLGGLTDQYETDEPESIYIPTLGSRPRRLAEKVKQRWQKRKSPLTRKEKKCLHALAKKFGTPEFEAAALAQKDEMVALRNHLALLGITGAEALKKQMGLKNAGVFDQATQIIESNDPNTLELKGEVAFLYQLKKNPTHVAAYQKLSCVFALLRGHYAEVKGYESADVEQFLGQVYATMHSGETLQTSTLTTILEAREGERSQAVLKHFFKVEDTWDKAQAETLISTFFVATRDSDGFGSLRQEDLDKDMERVAEGLQLAEISGETLPSVGSPNWRKHIAKEILNIDWPIEEKDKPKPLVEVAL